MPSELIVSNVKEVVWNFACDGCGCQGKLTVGVNEKLKPFGCPEGCGATYVMWRPSLRWQLRCVVKPYFADNILLGAASPGPKEGQ